MDGGEGHGWRGPPGPWSGPWSGPDGRARRPRGPRLFLAVLIGAIQILGTRIAAGRDDAFHPEFDALAYVLLLIGPAALVLRGRWPVLAYGISVAAAVAYLVLGYPSGPYFLAALVALFNAVRRGRRAGVGAVTAAGYGGFALAALPGTIVISSHEVADISLGQFVAVTAWTAVALALAGANKVRSEHFAEIAQTRTEAARARHEQSRRQASDERLRIARELHDVLGHHLSLINVRAGVGLHLLDTQPEQARDALEAIKLASSEALREVRGVLAALNPQDESAPRSPAPGLSEIDRLVEDARAAGLAVAVHRTGDAAVAGDVSRATYRIVQEALTNVRRHAGPSAAVTIEFRYAADTLTVVVDDTGTGILTSTSDGNGIPGMRERALALGGTLNAGPRPGGGFRVEARLPIAGSDEDGEVRP